MNRSLVYFYKAPQDPIDLGVAIATHDTFIFTKGDEKALAQLPPGKTARQYVRSDAIQDAGSGTPKQNQVAFKKGDFATLKKDHPDWFLRDSSGNMIPAVTPKPGASNYYMMDYGNPGYQQWYVLRVKELRASSPLWSGTFLDNLECSLGKRQQQGAMPAKYKTDADYNKALFSFLQALVAGGITNIAGNLISRRDPAIWSAVLAIIQGALDESWGCDWGLTNYLSVPDWLSDLALVVPGKSIYFVTQGNQADTQRQLFAYASYLLVAADGISFRYSNSDGHYGETWSYGSYAFDLGAPETPMLPYNGVYYRIFERGHVKVDPVAHVGEIVCLP